MLLLKFRLFYGSYRLLHLLWPLTTSIICYHVTNTFCTVKEFFTLCLNCILNLKVKTFICGFSFIFEFFYHNHIGKSIVEINFIDLQPSLGLRVTVSTYHLFYTGHVCYLIISWNFSFLWDCVPCYTALWLL